MSDWVVPDQWRRTVIPRRGGMTVPWPAPPADAVEQLSGRLADPSFGTVEDAEFNPGPRAEGLDFAAAWIRGGQVTPRGAAVAALLAGDYNGTLTAEAWVARCGVAFAARAVAEMITLTFHPDHRDETVYARSLETFDPSEWNHPETRRTNEDVQTVFTCATVVRASLATATDDDHAAALTALGEFRAGPLPQRVVTSFLAPARSEWIDADIAALAEGPCRGLAGKLLTLLVLAAGTPAQFRALGESQADVYSYWLPPDRMLGTLADVLGSGLMEILERRWYRDLAGIRSSYTSGLTDEALATLGVIPADRAVRVIVAESFGTHIAGFVRSGVLTRDPARTLRVLAQDHRPPQPEGEPWLAPIHRDVIATVPAAVLDGLPVEDRALVDEVLGDGAGLGRGLADRLDKGERYTTVFSHAADRKQAITWLAAIRTDEALGLLAERADRKNVMPALLKLTKKDPARALRVLASWEAEDDHRRGVVAGVLRNHVLAHPETAAAALAPPSPTSPASTSSSPASSSPASSSPISPAPTPSSPASSSPASPSPASPTPSPASPASASSSAASSLPASLSPSFSLPDLSFSGVGVLGAAARERVERILAETASSAPIADLADVPAALRTGVKAKRLPGWLVVGALPGVALRDGTVLPEPAVRELIDLIARSTFTAPQPGLAEVREACDRASLAAFAWGLFTQWRAADHPSADKQAMLALGLLGDDSTVPAVSALFGEWAFGAAARVRTGIEVLGAIGSDVALTHLRRVSRKAKQKGFRKLAEDKLDRIAEARGFTPIELADRIVPDLDLGADGRLLLDYGPRRFVVTFDSWLTPQIREENGRALTRLPRPAATDDAARAAEAQEAYKTVKREVKDIAAERLRTLEEAMLTERSWTAADFRTLIRDHPLVRHIARGLIWRVVGGPAFRIAEDRTAAGVEDDELVLDETARIGLYHPATGDPALTQAWAAILDDYDQSQPFPQLRREVFTLSPEQAAAVRIDDFAGSKAATGLLYAMASRGWRFTEGHGALSRDWPSGHTVTIEFFPWYDPMSYDTDEPRELGAAIISGPPDTPFGALGPVAASETLRTLHRLAAGD
ncbi:DUF4132 domain-containing protein [Actinoplanes sp. G11-F43]|uniref:DUF4132 domain-containing protein n=1 Tax=Actinoplanes sp. G11-F43 TaxID=3424130 RepID=UPI003D3395BF